MRLSDWRKPNQYGDISPMGGMSDAELRGHMTIYKGFLEQWREWASMGAPEHEHFDAEDGLCICAGRFDVEGFFVHVILCWRLGFDAYPFGKANYISAKLRKGMHKDRQRRAWVDKELLIVAEALEGEQP